MFSKSLAEMELSLKVVVIGDNLVGKTCISLRYLTGEFATQTRPTVAAGFCNARVRLGQADIDLLIWDTAGQETYRGLTSQYYRDAKIAFIVFDLTSPKTLNSVAEWHTRLTDANQSPIVCVLVGNKVDLANRQVSSEQGQAVADERKMLYRETSAVTGKGITEVFEDACEEYLRRFPAEFAQAVPLAPTPVVERKSCC
jgi:small GTP-binding protein